MLPRLSRCRARLQRAGGIRSPSVHRPPNSLIIRATTPTRKRSHYREALRAFSGRVSTLLAGRGSTSARERHDPRVVRRAHEALRHERVVLLAAVAEQPDV